MSVALFVSKLTSVPDEIAFSDTMALIDSHFDYTPSHFTNGTGDRQAINEAGTNEGSCKIFALGKLLALDEAQMLHCFGDYYRVDVLSHPDGNDHANIRNFMIHGWGGIAFDHAVLKAKGE
ncbi:MAG: HopJ type III effector protein [Gammaproteobacteria bacterium]|nr:HopJ type III effector protein [Gammaproteobacteria bacterium]